MLFLLISPPPVSELRESKPDLPSLDATGGALGHVVVDEPDDDEEEEVDYRQVCS